MSMHIEGPWLSTTSTKKKSVAHTKRQKEELEREWRTRNLRLVQMGLKKESFDQYIEWVYGRGKKTKAKTVDGNNCPTATATPKNKFPLGPLASTPPTETRVRPWITGPVSSKPSPVYTGTKIIGVAQMAKSNAVPVFSNEEIIDIARMRR